MIIDAHNHIGKDKDGLSQNTDELLVNMRNCNIDYAVAFPFDEQGDLIEASLKLLAQSDKIIPFFRFDPNTITTDALVRVIDNDKFKGVKLHPRAQAFNPLDTKFFPLYEVIEKKRLPLLIHTRKYGYDKNSDPDSIATLSDHFPDMKIIMAHLASFTPIALDYVKRKENLYIETSTAGAHRIIALACSRVGSEKIVFGSDTPYSDNEIELLKIKKAPISNDDKENILWNNMKKILGL